MQAKCRRAARDETLTNSTNAAGDGAELPRGGGKSKSLTSGDHEANIVAAGWAVKAER